MFLTNQTSFNRLGSNTFVLFTFIIIQQIRCLSAWSSSYDHQARRSPFRYVLSVEAILSLPNEIYYTSIKGKVQPLLILDVDTVSYDKQIT